MPMKTMFQYYLMQARGQRSIHKFAQDAGVDHSYLSKLFKNEDINYPSPEILGKLAKVADNNVTYEDFMVACEYMPKQEVLVNDKSKGLLEILKGYIGIQTKVVNININLNMFYINPLIDVFYRENTQEIVFMFDKSSITTKFENIIYLEDVNTICLGKRDSYIILYFLDVVNKENIN